MNNKIVDFSPKCSVVIFLYVTFSCVTDVIHPRLVTAFVEQDNEIPVEKRSHSEFGIAVL